MKAITLGESGVKLSEIDPPSPKSSQVLVKVRACGMNRSDLLETQGQSFGHLSGDTKVLGGEFAGEVVEVGSETQGLVVGDKVMCISSVTITLSRSRMRNASPRTPNTISTEI